MNIDTDGTRSSSSSAFLPHAVRNNNLTVQTLTLATKIVFSGQQAIGVQVTETSPPAHLFPLSGAASASASTKTYTIFASKEILLAGGTHNTPRLLMLSGIGPAASLTRLGIETVADLCVGCTMFNHYSIAMQFKTDSPWPFPDPRTAYAEYITNRTGYFNRTGGGAEGGTVAWLTSPTAHRGKPDIQLR
jgi:choline dehydrogenase-like flavoprotein